MNTEVKTTPVPVLERDPVPIVHGRSPNPRVTLHPVRVQSTVANIRSELIHGIEDRCLH